MSFPWNKLKKTSISQLVKDHVRSQSPLMVETGFPTSLVDLFVKNRQRFTRTSKKKRPPPVVPEPHLSSLSSLSQSLPLSSPIAPPLPARYTIERSQLKGCQGKGERIDLDEAVDKNMVLIALLKIFMVVVLVLGTKNLVRGITISTLLLFIFEYSEHIYRWLMPCALVGAKMVELEEDCVFKAPLPREEFCSSDFTNQIQEIHAKEKTVESSRGSKLKCEGKDSEGVVMEKEKELTSELLESKTKKSHKSKMKSKMTRFLAKKFRRKTSNQMMPIRENDDIIQEKDKLEDFNDCQKSSEKVLEATIAKVDSLTRKEQNSASIVLLLVVLVGLTGGRTFALVFTLTWCLMSKQVLLTFLR